MKKAIAIITAFIMTAALAGCTININTVVSNTPNETSSASASVPSENESAAESAPESSAVSETESATVSEAESEQQPVENRIEYRGVSVVLPDNFTYKTYGDAAQAYPDGNEYSSDCIGFAYREDEFGDFRIENYNKDDLAKYDKIDYADHDIDYTFISFEKTKIGGRDAARYEFKTVYEGETEFYRQVWVFMDNEIVYITVSSVTGEYDEAMYAALDTVSVEG